MNKKQIYRRYFDKEKTEKVSKKKALEILIANYPGATNLNILDELRISTLRTPGAFYSMKKEFLK